MQRWKGFPTPTEPALDPDAKREFLKCLEQSQAYLEFGSGGSTLVADALGIKTLSVESDRFYARVIRQALSQDTTVRIMDVYIGLTAEWSKPFLESPTESRIRKWRKYWERPFDLLRRESWFPDLVLVDGRFRRACVLQTARTALLVGFPVRIFVDDYFVERRAHYRALEDWLGKPEQAGRAALFMVTPNSAELPSPHDIDQAARDYR